jgi:hypothetical protein
VNFSAKLTAVARADATSVAAPLRRVHDRADERAGEVVPFPRASALRELDQVQVGVISNPRSRRNRQGNPVHRRGGATADMLVCEPATKDELTAALAEFKARGVGLIVVDGGDGTVRDVLSAAMPVFGAALPPIAVIPSGKTNALALDLGIPWDWSAGAAQLALGDGRFTTRAPVEITGEDGVTLSGFLFGAGAFVRATDLAQRTHNVGAFGGVAVGLSLSLAIAQTMFAGANNAWRAGDRIGITDLGDGTAAEHDLYLLFGSTLRRLPIGLRPLGGEADGLNILAVEAPPRLLPLAVPAILAGREGGWLARAGYHHRHDARPTRLHLPGGFVLDGERYAPGSYEVRAGTPITFVTP